MKKVLLVAAAIFATVMTLSFSTSADAYVQCDRYGRNCRNIMPPPPPPHRTGLVQPRPLPMPLARPRYGYADPNIYRGRPGYGYGNRNGYGNRGTVTTIQRYHREYTRHVGASGGYSAVPSPEAAYSRARMHHVRACVPCIDGFSQDPETCECRKVTYHPGD